MSDDLATQPAEPANGKILVVEDDPDIRSILSRFLSRRGYVVKAAENGAEALELLAVEPVDLILSDVRMPRMDGLELTRRVRRLEGLRELPVVLCSSLASDDDRREGLSAGATVYLVKGETPPAKIVDVLGSFVS